MNLPNAAANRPLPRRSRFASFHFAFLLALAGVAAVRADDGYRLWLRYDAIADVALKSGYTVGTERIVLSTPTGTESPTVAAARDELAAGLRGLLGTEAKFALEKNEPAVAPSHVDGYTLTRGRGRLVIAGGSDAGVLYGAFALLRRLQLHQPIDPLDVRASPKISRRLLNHWDNLTGTIERGYAGRSLWEWDKLPGEVSPRYRDYARACASIGINGSVITNVNANAQVLTADYLPKVAALAAAFRPYGIKLYLTARFSAPVEIGGLKTADPLDADVIKWWRSKADEIYALIPDFGGFLVKANSEGQPGPQTYQRTHADGANVLADAVRAHGGIVIWRAFVYDAAVADDRHKQAYSEFVPLDGKFRDNVVVQVKNGAIDFMPREPFHPLFGAMPKTPLALEVQITQEYTGGSSELCYLAPMWREVLTADTFRPKAGSTVAHVIDGSSDHHALSVIAGVANTGSDRTWSGNHLAPLNWYAYGRLAWDHTLSSESIAEEWTRLTFGSEPRVLQTLMPILLASRETVVDYSMPLGLHHIMARGHHQGPGPWVTGGRADQTSVYFHRADEKGVGFDRTATGSNALGQYAPQVAQVWADLATCPDNLLLWFHHLPWDYRMRSGDILWNEICLHYQHGVDHVRGWQKSWSLLAGAIDDERFAAITKLFAGQEREARIWRDTCTQYFATFSKRPLPPGVEPPAWPLEKLHINVPFSVADN
jgi:alpha-glucuronidase